jgi:hypothetical protein
MKNQEPYKLAAGVIALALWVAVVAVVTVKHTAETSMGGWRSWSLPYILLSAPMTVLVTCFVAKFRLSRRKAVSYGTLLLGPSVSAALVLVGYRVYCLGWRVLTTAYWADRKGSLLSVPEFVHVASVCVLPAIAVVVYLQWRHRAHDVIEA